MERPQIRRFPGRCRADNRFELTKASFGTMTLTMYQTFLAPTRFSGSWKRCRRGVVIISLAYESSGGKVL